MFHFHPEAGNNLSLNYGKSIIIQFNIISFPQINRELNF